MEIDFVKIDQPCGTAGITPQFPLLVPSMKLAPCAMGTDQFLYDNIEMVGKDAFSSAS